MWGRDALAGLKSLVQEARKMWLQQGLWNWVGAIKGCPFIENGKIVSDAAINSLKPSVTVGQPKNTHVPQTKALTLRNGRTKKKADYI